MLGTVKHIGYDAVDNLMGIYYDSCCAGNYRLLVPRVWQNWDRDANSMHADQQFTDTRIAIDMDFCPGAAFEPGNDVLKQRMFGDDPLRVFIESPGTPAEGIQERPVQAYGIARNYGTDQRMSVPSLEWGRRN